MKPYFAKSGAWVQCETLFPSGMYNVTLYAPDDNVHDRIRCDDYRDALAYRRSFVAIAKNWGKQ
jgi:hypothetical protein